MKNGPYSKAASELHRNPRPLPDWSAYKMHLTRHQVDRALHYGHIIPISKGFTHEFFANNYPGWCLNSMYAVFKAAGIWLHGVGHNGHCHRQLKYLHFDSVDSWAVEWDESISTDDGRRQVRHASTRGPTTTYLPRGGCRPVQLTFH